MSNSKKVEAEIKEFGMAAKCDLAWLAAIHVAIKSIQQNIPAIATELLTNPVANLRISIYPPANGQKVLKKAIDSFNIFGACALVPASQDPGHYLNKSAILYADAIINAFLDKAYIAIAVEKGFDQKELKKASISGKLSEIEACSNHFLNVSSLNSAKHAKFLAQLRHIITHQNGFVDGVFLKNCGIDYPNLQMKQGASPLWDQHIWPDLNAFLGSYKPPQNSQKYQASLAIEKVIIPYLEHSIEFVDEFIGVTLKIF